MGLEQKDDGGKNTVSTQKMRGGMRRKTRCAEGVKNGLIRLTFTHVGIKIEATDRRDEPCFAMGFFSEAAAFVPEDSICALWRSICCFIISS